MPLEFSLTPLDFCCRVHPHMGDMQGEFQNTFRPVGEQSDRHPDPAGMCRNFPTHTVLVQKEWLDEVNFVATPSVNLVNL